MVLKQKHSAKFNDDILDNIADLVGNEIETRAVLDPFAGSGRVYELEQPCNLWCFGVEIEPEYAAMNSRTFVGDSAVDLPKWFADDSLDGIVTSPCYGNRMADVDMRESVQATYAKDLGRRPSERSSGAMPFGKKYFDLHARVWGQVTPLVRPGGFFCLNVKDHIRDGKRVHVGLWHLNTLTSLGWEWQDHVRVPCGGNRRGANSSARVPCEDLFFLRKR